MALEEISSSLLLKSILHCQRRSGSPQAEEVLKITDILSETTLKTINIEDHEQYADLIKIVHNIVGLGLVTEFPEKEERDYDRNDFVGIADTAEESFICLRQLISKLQFDCEEPKLQYSFLIPILKLCATHSDTFLWSSHGAMNYSGDVLLAVLQLTKANDVKTLLCQRIAQCENTLFKVMLLSIRPSLTKETWTRNASSCHIFKWLLFHVKHPYLSDYLSDVLPPSLMFVDHHAIRSKVLGIQCLDFIINNVPPTELKMYGRADVVYDALHKLIFLREATIVRDLYPCILKLMSTQEKDHSDPNQFRKWCHCDEVYNQLLWSMELEDNIIVRRLWSLHILSFIQHLGITVMKHLKRTEAVLLKYLSICEGPEEISRTNALKALVVFIKIVWPRINEKHCVNIFQSILDLVQDIETSKGAPEVKETVLYWCKECLLLLTEVCPLAVQEMIASVDDLPNDIPGIQFIRDVCSGYS